MKHIEMSNNIYIYNVKIWFNNHKLELNSFKLKPFKKTMTKSFHAKSNHQVHNHIKPFH